VELQNINAPTAIKQQYVLGPSWALPITSIGRSPRCNFVRSEQLAGVDIKHGVREAGCSDAASNQTGPSKAPSARRYRAVFKENDAGLREAHSLTFWNLVLRAAQEAPDRVIIADDHGHSLTTAQFRDTSEQVAAALPISPGDSVSWQLPTSIEAAVLMAALARIGAIQNPIIPAFREREVGIVTSQVQPSLYVTPDTWRGFDFATMAKGFGCRVLAVEFEDTACPDLRLPVGDPEILPPAPSLDSRWIYYSSGTTSVPKGVKHTDSSLIAGATGIIELSTFGDGDVYPMAWPLTHIGGISMVTACLKAGLKLVLFDTWDPATTPERMAAHAPTILGSAQPFFRAYVDAQRRKGTQPLFPSLRIITAGGAPTPPEIVRELIDVLGVRGVQGSYGLTEFPIATAASPGDPDDILLRSVGRLSPGVRARVVDGEIRLKGPQCFDGYVDEALNAKAFDVDGWFCSGDLGEIDANGNVFITGRLKDVIVRNAENISALEIEDVLLRHRDITDVAVIGLPDARTGERVCAVVVPSADVTVDQAELAAHCIAMGLAKYKCPEQIVLVAKLERNAMGKALKQQLRKEILEGLHD
jgi:cyclohexanecarboxylate-CoA ligase